MIAYIHTYVYLSNNNFEKETGEKTGIKIPAKGQGKGIITVYFLFGDENPSSAI